jgi:hypothetical protein
MQTWVRKMSIEFIPRQRFSHSCTKRERATDFVRFLTVQL